MNLRVQEQFLKKKKYNLKKKLFKFENWDGVLQDSYL
jgi:hypothetical protein